MVTHYDRGEADCTRCGKLALAKDMVAVPWWKLSVCKRCADLPPIPYCKTACPNCGDQTMLKDLVDVRWCDAGLCAKCAALPDPLDAD